MGNNELLVALGLLDRGITYVNVEKRQQVDRVGLVAIQQCLSQALERLVKYRQPRWDLVLMELSNVLQVITELLKDESYKETDSSAKEYIDSHLRGSLSLLYVLVGRYYAEHDFNYSVRIEKLLNKIVDYCVDDGFYFGVDEELREEGKL